MGAVLREVCRVWEIADEVEAFREGHWWSGPGLPLMEGCRAVRRESPRCCMLCPLPGLLVPGMHCCTRFCLPLPRVSRSHGQSQA